MSLLRPECQIVLRQVPSLVQLPYPLPTTYSFILAMSFYSCNPNQTLAVQTKLASTFSASMSVAFPPSLLTTDFAPYPH